MILLEGAYDGAGQEHEDRRGHAVAGRWRKSGEIIRNRGGGCLRQTWSAASYDQVGVGLGRGWGEEERYVE
jgi:hypothetical protein